MDREILDHAGSYLVRGPVYDVAELRGSLWLRQTTANRLGCVAYVEQHLNGHTNPDINYAMAICARNASSKSVEWAKRYTELVAEHFEMPDRGVVVGPRRGSYNVKLTRCPAFLAEPGFISNPEFAGIVVTGEGLDALAFCLVQSIRDHFPGGGLIGLSVGHRYRGKADPGAPVYDDPNEEEDPEWDDEAEIADGIIRAAVEMLVAVGVDSVPPESEAHDGETRNANA